MGCFHSALEVKQALIDVATSAIGDDTVLVRNGHPGTFQPDDIVSFGRFSIVEEPGPMSASKRSRDVIFQVYATISVFRGGGQDQEDVAESRCLQLADLIADALRVEPTLGGRAFWCFRTGYDSDGSTDPQIIAKGRLIEATVEFSGKGRIQTF